MLGALLDYPQATNASEVKLESSSVQVTREIDGGLQTLELTIPAIITTDLRLNEPRYASLPNIMKAKKKELNVISLNDTGVDANPRTELLSVELPPSREAGVIVETVDELVDKLKNEAKVIRMSILVIAEHDNNNLKGATLNTIISCNIIKGEVTFISYRF